MARRIKKFRADSIADSTNSGAGAAEGGDGLDYRVRCLLWRAGVEGRVRVVLDSQLDRLGDLGAGLAADQVERHVDSGGDPRCADDLAVLDEAPTDRLCAVVGKAVEEEPVRGRPLAIEQPGVAEDLRAGAD